MTLGALKVIGPFRGPSGYDRHTRAFVRELARQGVAVELRDLPEWGPATLRPEERDPWFEALARPVDARVALHFAMPHQVRPDPERANVNYTMFEATRIPAVWVSHNLGHDLVVVPTESSRRAWVASGFPAGRIRLCPLGIDPDVFGRAHEPLPLSRDDGEPVARYGVRFLNVSELGPRKNLVGLLRAWIRATERGQDAILVVKLGAYAPGWYELFRRDLVAMQEALGKSLAEAAPVHVTRRILADADMPRLFAAATHYISLSFGEGWDQAAFEAAATGLRMIVPDHSAYPAYLDPSVARMLPARERPAAAETLGELFVGADWWEPDEDAAVEAIREAVEGRDAGLASPRGRILTELTWERATRRLIEILSEAEAGAAVRT